MKAIRKHVTYANAMSSIAVFLVIGGGAAYAAINLPANSVGSRELQPNAVKTGYLAKNAVRTGKVALEAIKAGKLAKNAVPTNRLRDSAVTTDKIGNDAVTGEKVDEASLAAVPDANKLGGRTASEYLRSPIRRVEAVSAVTSGVGQFRNVTASCPSGERAIAGGGMWTQTDGSPTGFNVLQGSRPVPFTGGTDDATGWQATGVTDNAAGRQLRAYVLCIPSS